MNVHQPVPAEVEEEDFFLMSNLRPSDTGLPMVVWVSNRGHARHDARVKVCRTPGDRIAVDDMAVVGIRPSPELIEGPLDGESLKLVQRWIALNADTLIGYWNSELSTRELFQNLKRIE
ncbi:MAG: hypothetical protein Q8S03_14190 [Brevundimonas sp.]|uniref:hypothetical protein n=1 Tax=Brevundimonas sp. TaxID=1871086 RepID=UPI002735FF6A|nr:hypothetical protein [Brevundimonas sp.]MBX9614528.1 hypothetical protein [Caulobacteraceae bacterium]MDP3405840.1 hypothetical protein [Brevundimonas sp.]